MKRNRLSHYLFMACNAGLSGFVLLLAMDILLEDQPFNQFMDQYITILMAGLGILLGLLGIISILIWIIEKFVPDKEEQQNYYN